MRRRLIVTAGFFLDLLRDVVGTAWARMRRWWRRVVLGEDVLVVGVDIFPFFERMTGVGWYEWNLLAHLPAADVDLRLNLYAHTFAAPDEPSPPRLPADDRTRFRYHHLPRGFLLPIRPTILALRTLVEPVLLFLDGNDVFFAPNFFVPRRHLPAVRRLVATVHDLAFLRLPHTVQRETLANLRLNLPHAMFAADALIAVSEATAEDLKEVTGASERRIHIVHEGVDPAFGCSSGEVPAGLPERYLLFVSTLEPRKNIVGLLDGFAGAVRGGYPGALVLVGRWGWRTEEAQRALAASTVAERIVHLDYLQRRTLSAVMERAEALVFPSWLEGFGLPALEAMACGVPVILSDRAALPEIGGDAALYCDPERPTSLAAAILRLAAEPTLRARLGAAGRERAALFRWDEAARATVGVFRTVRGDQGAFPDAYRV
jgi:glycosyltransferase involved in cell wall biosynthesis